MSHPDIAPHQKEPPGTGRETTALRDGNRCRLVVDLQAALQDPDLKDSEIAPLVLELCRRHRVRTNESYVFRIVRDAIHDADEKLVSANESFPLLGTENQFKLEATSVICKAIGATLRPGRTLHRLLLNICREVWKDDWLAIALKPHEEASYEFYEACLTKDATAIYKILEARFFAGDE